MVRPALRLLLAPLAGLLLLGGCFAPGGTPPVGCDLEPNGTIATARPLAYDVEATSCAQSGADEDVFRLPHQAGADHPIAIACEGGSGATVSLEFLPDGATTPFTLIPDLTCPGEAQFLNALAPGTPYLRVSHHSIVSQPVTVSATPNAL